MKLKPEIFWIICAILFFFVSSFLSTNQLKHFMIQYCLVGFNKTKYFSIILLICMSFVQANIFIEVFYLYTDDFVCCEKYFLHCNLLKNNSSKNLNLGLWNFWDYVSMTIKSNMFLQYKLNVPILISTYISADR